MAMMLFSKKAQVFSLIAVLMSALFVMIFAGGNDVIYDRNVKTKRIAIESADQFVDDLEGFVREGSKRAGRRILHDLIIYHNGSNNFTNFTRSFEECFHTGEFNATDRGVISCSRTYENVSFENITTDIYQLAEETYDMNITQKDVEVSVRQTSPYEFRIDTEAIIAVDRDGVGVGSYGWEREISTTGYFSIVGMPDPLSTDKDYNRTIEVHPEMEMLQARTSNIDGNISLLAEFIDNKYFIIDQRAPTIVQMLEGNIYPEEDYEKGSNSFGITSYLNGTFYDGNSTSMVEYRYGRRSFDPEELERMNDSAVSDEVLLEKDELSLLNISVGERLDVAGCCDDEGCFDDCG